MSSGKAYFLEIGHSYLLEPSRWMVFFWWYLSWVASTSIAVLGHILKFVDELVL